eukprot:Gb_08708 [translate_table: standard]
MQVRSLVGDRVSLIVQTLSGVTIAFTMGLIIAWHLAIVMIAVQPLIIICFYVKRVLLKTMSAKALKAQDQGSQLAAEAVANHQTITAFSSQERILNLFEHTQKGPHDESMRQSWFAGFVLAGTSQSLNLCTWALDFLCGKYDYLAKGSDAVKSVFAILDRNSRINPNDEEGMKPDKIEGNVEVKNVDFAYPSRPDIIILKNFCLRIKAGSSVALVGQSGSGKSTIIGLIERFYDPLRGTVKIDGRDIKTYNLRWRTAPVVEDAPAVMKKERQPRWRKEATQWLLKVEKNATLEECRTVEVCISSMWNKGTKDASMRENDHPTQCSDRLCRIAAREEKRSAKVGRDRSQS